MAIFRVRGVSTIHLDVYATASTNTFTTWLVSSPINNWLHAIIPFLDLLRLHKTSGMKTKRTFTCMPTCQVG